jgi:hypothetical protein
MATLGTVTARQLLAAAMQKQPLFQRQPERLKLSRQLSSSSDRPISEAYIGVKMVLNGRFDPTAEAASNVNEPPLGYPTSATRERLTAGTSPPVAA